jgi:hypothetical protein
MASLVSADMTHQYTDGAARQQVMELAIAANLLE